MTLTPRSFNGSTVKKRDLSHQMPQLVDKLTYMQEIEHRSQLPHTTEVPSGQLRGWRWLHQRRHSSGTGLLRRQLLFLLHLHPPLLLGRGLRSPLSRHLLMLLLQPSSRPDCARPGRAATPRNRASTILGSPASGVSVAVVHSGILTRRWVFTGRSVAGWRSVAGGRERIWRHGVGDPGC